MVSGLLPHGWTSQVENGPDVDPDEFKGLEAVNQRLAANKEQQAVTAEDSQEQEAYIVI